MLNEKENIAKTGKISKKSNNNNEGVGNKKLKEKGKSEEEKRKDNENEKINEILKKRNFHNSQI